MNSIAQFITHHREAQKMNMTQLANEAGVNPSFVSRVEAGVRIRPASLKKILAGLGFATGSPNFIEAFALHAADAALDPSKAGAKGRVDLARRLGATTKAQLTSETKLLEQIRALPAGQRETIEMLLDNPAAIDGLNALLYVKLPAKRGNTK